MARPIIKLFEHILLWYLVIDKHQKLSTYIRWILYFWDNFMTTNAGLRHVELKERFTICG